MHISREEIEFMLQCCESNHDGKIDYIGFTDQFHEPAKEIGFNLAVLLTNLSEHMPNEPRYYLLNIFFFMLNECIYLWLFQCIVFLFCVFVSS